MLSVAGTTIKANSQERIDEVAVGRAEEGDEVIVRLLRSEGGGRPCNGNVPWDSMKLFPLEVKSALFESSSSNILCMPPDMCCIVNSILANGKTLPVSQLQPSLSERFSVGFGMQFVLAQGNSVKGNLFHLFSLGRPDKMCQYADACGTTCFHLPTRLPERAHIFPWSHIASDCGELGGRWEG